MFLAVETSRVIGQSPGVPSTDWVGFLRRRSGDNRDNAALRTCFSGRREGQRSYNSLGIYTLVSSSHFLPVLKRDSVCGNNKCVGTFHNLRAGQSSI